MHARVSLCRSTYAFVLVCEFGFRTTVEVRWGPVQGVFVTGERARVLCEVSWLSFLHTLVWWAAEGDRGGGGKN